MPLGYAQGSIAGVDLQDTGGAPCKVLLLNAHNARQTVVGASQAAADGTIYTQVLEVSGGAQFGVKIEYAPPSVIEEIVAAIEAAMLGGGSFNVNLQDDLSTINQDCVPDYGAGWYTVEAQRTHPNVVKGIQFNFLTV
jgi:DNA-binding NarL/FixJ family response regulator